MILVLSDEERKRKKREYSRKPEVKARQKKRSQIPGVKAKIYVIFFQILWNDIYHIMPKFFCHGLSFVPRRVSFFESQYYKLHILEYELDR